MRASLIMSPLTLTGPEVEKIVAVATGKTATGTWFGERATQRRTTPIHIHACILMSHC